MTDIEQDDLPNDVKQWFRLTLEDDYRRGYAHYQTAVDLGIAPEYARMFLRLNQSEDLCYL